MWFLSAVEPFTYSVLKGEITWKNLSVASFWNNKFLLFLLVLTKFKLTIIKLTFWNLIKDKTYTLNHTQGKMSVYTPLTWIEHISFFWIRLKVLWARISIALVKWWPVWFTFLPKGGSKLTNEIFPQSIVQCTICRKKVFNIWCTLSIIWWICKISYIDSSYCDYINQV